ncbi:MFS transporter [Paludisphaera mucosa]|uniref:MFS transporter n=1 Tax=Paludisphaera mucosa TaxID=3030827 RepID=A0ABT6F5V3_9BACT|nr:MFS transporter [Paludisphaera mucosa]
MKDDRPETRPGSENLEPERTPSRPLPDFDGGVPGRPAAMEVLRDGNFLRFLIGVFLVQLGAQMQNIAVGWEIYERTHSALALGMVGLAQVAPVLLLAIPSGHLSDRYDRKRLFLASNVLMFLAAAGLSAASAFGWPVGSIYAFLFLTGVGQALNRPARWAIQPTLVPRRLMLSAVTWNSSFWQTAAITGPALGGLVIALAHSATACYALNTAFLACVIGLNAMLKVRPTARDSGPVTIRTLLAGLRFVMKTEMLVAAMTLDLLAVLLGGATALLPIFARDILHVGPAGLGWLRAAPSIGSLSMAFLQTQRAPLQRTGPVLLGAVAGFGVATIVFGLSRNVYVSFAALLLTGAFDNISVVVRQTLTQMLTPDAMRGRVSAINSIFIASSNELGEFESGILARFTGAVGAVVLGGLGALLTVIAVAALWPALRRLGPLNDLKPADPETLP